MIECPTEKNKNAICNLGYACDGCPYNSDHDPRDISKRKTITIPINLLCEPNNCFVKEHCVFGHVFDADFDVIYSLPKFGYVCYDCAEKLTEKVELLKVRECCLKLLEGLKKEPEEYLNLNNLWFCSCGNDLRYFKFLFEKAKA